MSISSAGSLPRIATPRDPRRDSVFPALDGLSVFCLLSAFWLLCGAFGDTVQAQIKGQVRPAPAPVWNKGVQPISAESYYNAIECGKQGGDNPACVFWDTDLCKNEDFSLTWYTAYKEVAYTVWTAVRRKQPPPQPSYSSAQRTRVTIAVAPAAGSKNTLADFVVKRGDKPAAAMERSLAAGGGRFTFDYPAFAPTGSVTLDLIGKQRTLSCVLTPAVLRQMR